MFDPKDFPNTPKVENLGLDDPKCYKIQETECADIANVDTCLNVKQRYQRLDLNFYGLNHLIKKD